jgi:hypothetical protein
MDDDIGASEPHRRIERLLEWADAIELSDPHASDRRRVPDEVQRTAFGLEIRQDTFGRAFTDEWLPL